MAWDAKDEDMLDEKERVFKYFAYLLFIHLKSV
jgi:hypothetical protein